jgi:hypothetical protein
LEAAVSAIAAEERAKRIRMLLGTTRLVLGTAIGGEAGLTLNDSESRPRIVLETPATGEPSLRFLNESGETMLRLPR